jgi:hypothetical protein|tara:strand:- start:2056 stop:2463 length:408 start_codon:yes stop_codon:yes gene_type:complete
VFHLTSPLLSAALFCFLLPFISRNTSQTFCAKPKITAIPPSHHQDQLRAQAREIGKLQGTVDSLHVENRDLRRQVDAPPSGQILNSLAKAFSGQETLRLESVEEKGTASWAFPNPGTGRFMPCTECGYAPVLPTQ